MVRTIMYDLRSADPGRYEDIEEIIHGLSGGDWIKPQESVIYVETEDSKAEILSKLSQSLERGDMVIIHACPKKILAFGMDRSDVEWLQDHGIDVGVLSKKQ